jgi:mono/diheme cytochrome c family protein
MKNSNRFIFFRFLWPALLLFISQLWVMAQEYNRPEDTRQLKTGKQIFMAACATCHGSDGRGVSQSLLGFDQPLPDFTDCEFASREPEGDWVIIAFHGGPIRGFSEFMPAFGKLLTRDQLLKAVQYIKAFCTDKKWPRGELNLPKALVTEKAFPEDEAIFATSVDKDFKKITNKFVYETRFGSRNQIEVAIPFGWYKLSSEDGSSNTSPWSANLGDLALGYKRVLLHNHRKGSILSVVGEVILPTGDEADGFGKGTVVLEPFLVFSQILPGDFFMHAQAALEFPLNRDKGENEGLFRLALGRSFSFKQDGRTWSPMLELLASRELESGGKFLYEIVPQIQVTLNQRQHIMFNIGVRIPVNDTEGRDIQILAYILWDWFDGGFFEGWAP